MFTSVTAAANYVLVSRRDAVCKLFFCATETQSLTTIPQQPTSTNETTEIKSGSGQLR